MKKKYKVLTEIYSSKKGRHIEKFIYVIAYNKMQALKTVKENIGYETIDGRLQERMIGYDNHLDGNVWLYEEPTFIESE